MRYIQRGLDGKLVGHFANEQPYAKELAPDNHPDILAWNEARKPKLSDGPDELTLIKSRLAALEARLQSETTAKR